MLTAAAAVLALALLFAAPAAADYEQVGSFAQSGEGAQLESVLGMAVNVSGAGGVEAGSLYAVGRNNRVLRYGPDGTFREAWGWGVANGAGEFQRCGPALETPVPCTPADSNAPFGGEEPGHFEKLAGVAVHQATGNVYVLNSISHVAKREHNLVEVFSADGTEAITGFGDAGAAPPFPAPTESIAEGPGKLHEVGGTASGIAVDAAGRVYLTDYDSGFIASPPGESRVLSFEPQSPGDFEHYVYSGRAEDIVLGPPGARFTRIALDEAGRLYGAGGEAVQELDPAESGTPLCSFKVPGGGLQAMTVNPASGEVFYFAKRKVHRLGPCDPQAGAFEEAQEAVLAAPETQQMLALAVNPELVWSPERPAGVLYGGDGENGSGDIFAPAEVHAPSVESESVADTTTSSATLRARIDPHGFATHFVFQYLSEAAYQANEPDERQALTVSATGGVFGLGFEGHGVGGAVRADLTAGSALASNLTSAKGTASMSAAAGTATLHGAVGKGTVIAGSTTITAASASEGSFEAGQAISGQGIPAGATIAAAAGGELTISAAATASKANVDLNAGTATLTAASASEGSFEVGQAIEGQGIGQGTRIVAVSGAELTLSRAVTKPGEGVAIQAGATVLTSVATSEGSFEAGQPISGEGIPAGTTITAAKAGELTISKPLTKPGTGVAISSAGPAPLAVGQRIEGPGIPAGTTILAAKAGELTLSAPTTSSGAAVQLHGGLPFDAPAGRVRDALASLPAIGAGNVAVSGGPGEEAGSSPYEIVFNGALTNTDLPDLDADGSALSGGSATATVQTENDGGGGFAEGAKEAPPGGGTIGGSGKATAAAAVSGLDPDTAYRFRVLATSECEGEGGEPCTTPGEAAAFRTYPAATAGLPDRRAYELVSPPLKSGGQVFPAEPLLGSCGGECKPPGGGAIGARYPMQSSPGGEAVVYQGSPFSASEGAAVLNEYLSERTDSGWRTAALSPALEDDSPGQGHVAFDADLDQGLIYQRKPTLSPLAPPEYPNLYAQSIAEPAALAPLLTAAPEKAPGAFQIAYAGHSADFSRHFFAANDALTGETPFAPPAPPPGAGEDNLYEWRAGGLSLVNVLPGNAAAPPGAAFGSQSPDAHAVSEDGSRVFWSDGAGNLYLREDGEATVQIEHGGAEFLTASPDGSKVLLDDGCLYDVALEACEDLTGGEGGFEGLAGHSTDLSRIYFVADAALSGEEENEQGAKAQPGAHNLYLWEEGALSFIATLLAADNDVNGTAEKPSDWVADPSVRTAQASPDGRWLAFLSKAPLTGHDNVGPACGMNSVEEFLTVPCPEVFLYDSATGTLRCASCNPTGEAPLGRSALRRIAEAPEWLPQPRYLSDSGRLYFDSSDRLSPLDTNDGVEDVYQFEPQGVGSCKREAGCVSLISTGAGTLDANLLAVDASGENVFFTTRERLLVRDRDELIDLYDAREGGGIAADTETTRPECQGEACQPAPAPPNDATPASSAFRGAGNVKPGGASKPRCPKGKRRVQSRGKSRCVKRQHRRRPARAANRSARSAG